MPLRTTLLALSLATVVSGCGFQLRSWDLSALSSVSVAARGATQQGEALVRALDYSGVEVRESGGDVVLRLSDEREERRSAAVTAAGRAAEVELTLEVRFSVHDADGEELAPERTLRVARVQRIDVDNIVGSSEEEALLRDEMRQELASRMVRSLAMLARAGDDA